MSSKRRMRHFVEWLLKNKEDRGIMANLRRAWSATTEHYAWPYLAEFCDLDNDDQRLIYLTVGACFAFHPQNGKEGNLGTTLHQIAIRQTCENPLEAYNARFRRLIACSTIEEVCRQLRSVVQLARAREIPVNYEQLLIDLHKWRHAAQKVKVQWAKTYYGSPKDEESSAANDTEASASTLS
jgi:CRISPR system Cascade subunit CasB